MAGKTSIEWTTHNWNPVRGCSRVSEGCRNCYAERVAARFSGKGNWGEGLAEWVTRPDGKREARWTGKVVAAPDHVLTQPLRWKAPRTIFVNSTSDLFHEDLPDAVIDRVFAVMALCPQHTFQILTKRPERMRAYVCDDAIGDIADEASQIWAENRAPNGEKGYLFQHWRGGGEMDIELSEWPLPNVWLGTSVEDQASADARIPHLLDTPAAIRFISAEPLLGPVDLQSMDGDIWDAARNALTGRWRWAGGPTRTETSPLDWVICGGESGPGARPMHPDWARSLRDQCAAADVPFFFKQWGAWLPWEPQDAPFWLSQAGAYEDGHTLFPGDMDGDPKWDDGLGLISQGEAHAAFQLVGKGKAGRRLDGVTHDAMPATDHAVVPSDERSGDARSER